MARLLASEEDTWWTHMKRLGHFILDHLEHAVHSIRTPTYVATWVQEVVEFQKVRGGGSLIGQESQEADGHIRQLGGSGKRHTFLLVGGFQNPDLQELRITESDFPAFTTVPYASIPSGSEPLIGNVHRSYDDLLRRLLTAAQVPGNLICTVLIRRINPVVSDEACDLHGLVREGARGGGPAVSRGVHCPALGRTGAAHREGVRCHASFCRKEQQ